MRQRVAVIVAVPIACVGSLVAHQLDYAIQAPDAVVRAQLLASSGHGYLRHLPLIVAACVAAALIGVVLDVVPSGSASAGRVTAWPLALVAPLAFTIQEHLERFLHDGVFPAHLFLQPVFLIGLALQVPFALFAWGVARTLLLAARRMASSLRGRVRQPTRRDPAAVRLSVARRVRRSILASRVVGRAPPLAVS